MTAVRIDRLAATRWVCMGQQFTRRSNALLTILRAIGPLLAPVFIVDQGSERACWRRRRWRRRYVRACSWVALRQTSLHAKPTTTHRCDTRFAHIPALLFLYSIAPRSLTLRDVSIQKGSSRISQLSIMQKAPFCAILIFRYPPFRLVQRPQIRGNSSCVGLTPFRRSDLA